MSKLLHLVVLTVALQKYAWVFISENFQLLIYDNKYRGMFHVHDKSTLITWHQLILRLLLAYFGNFVSTMLQDCRHWLWFDSDYEVLIMVSYFSDACQANKLYWKYIPRPENIKQDKITTSENHCSYID